MLSLSQPEFETIVEAGVKAIPEEFLKLLDNVRIVVEPWPNLKQKRKLQSNETLFGLYEGVPLAKRGHHYNAVLPDKITIFQQPIEQEADSIEEVTEIVKNTVWHEIAHHFGMDEKRVREAEGKRRKRGK